MIRIYTYSLEYGYLYEYQTETNSPTFHELVAIRQQAMRQNGFVDEAHVYVPYELRDKVKAFDSVYQMKGVNAQPMVKIKVYDLSDLIKVLHSLSDDIKTDWHDTMEEVLRCETT